MTRLLPLLLAALSLAAPASAGEELRVLSVEGGTLTSRGKPVPAGAVLRRDQPLRLDGPGRAVIQVGRSGHVLIKGPASLTADPGGARGFFLRAGAVLSVLPRLTGRFHVRTPAAVAAVRGTDFYVEARGKDAAYVCVCEGELAVTAGKPGPREKPRPLKGTHHNARLFRAGPRGLVDGSAPMTGHDDAEIAGLSALSRKTE